MPYQYALVAFCQWPRVEWPRVPRTIYTNGRSSTLRVKKINYFQRICLCNSFLYIYRTFRSIKYGTLCLRLRNIWACQGNICEFGSSTGAYTRSSLHIYTHSSHATYANASAGHASSFASFAHPSFASASSSASAFDACTKHCTDCSIKDDHSWFHKSRLERRFTSTHTCLSFVSHII